MGQKLISFLLFLGCVSYGSAMTCQKEGLFGITTHITCPQIGQPSDYEFCCGSEENRYCCPFPLGFDQKTVDTIIENDLGGRSDSGDVVAAPVDVRSKRQTNKVPDSSAVESPIVPQKVNETEGRVSDAVQKAKDKVKQKIKDKSKEKINKVIEEKTQRNLPRLIGILVGVVLVVLLVCVVCCCCCPFCLLAKRRNRGHVTRGGAEVTVTLPPQHAAAQPLQPYSQPQPYVQPQQQPYPQQPYPQQPYPPQQYPPQPAAGYPDQPPPYAEKQPAFNPNYANA
ncbi:Shisa family [Trinorchestia longiramus]|nr:Shisa family [Trinorchestia longiramus]